MNIDDIEKKDDDGDVSNRVYLNSAAKKSAAEAVSEDRQVCSGNPAAVCLGLLCALLLAVTIGLSVKHNGEREQLWSSYINMTMERDQLQTSYINMTMERDQLQSRFDSISKERDQLQGTNNRLQSSHDVLTLERDSLQRQFAEIREF
ncbi:hypothetical protein NFI96_027210 [Prochilodus magdalenae]|nr:hypothetical protein NFI96_027210 [Prochilodus magdalenae]